MIEIRENGVWRSSPQFGDWIGQLFQAERQSLYDMVLLEKPEIVFEVGTWRGGGSTLFLGRGLQFNDKGTLYTVESDRELFDQAIQNYEEEFPDLKKFVKLHHGDSLHVFPSILSGLKKPVDMVFLDGAEDARQSLRELTMFLPFMRAGAKLMMHDWNSEKARLVRPCIEGSAIWKIDNVLKPPHSEVGFMIATRTGPPDGSS